MERMKTLKLRTDGAAVTAAKQLVLSIALLFTIFPFVVLVWSGSTVTPDIQKMLSNMSLAGVCALTVFSLMLVLLSRYSPVKRLAIRKKLMLFTKLFIKSENDGTIEHSVTWKYAIKGKKIVIDLYPNGLIRDTALIGRQLSQYIGENLLEYEETDGKSRYVYGEYPSRYDGIELLREGVL
ncbi:hypothetical protein [Lachnoclostridium sp. An76]|uniref:hypothetical protein n=1 Tax=Lachnoclostridium sp. An76 TaxID=1965654 RepID=UPI000B3A4F38|nr:hypothetical protein [Lachnoclostridium sp. An76]OUN33940.1 hypothetical protein B5G27_10730 [Lachnoclostridium sp. An76]